MEELFMRIRFGALYANIYRWPSSFYASLYGQLDIWDTGEEDDHIEEETMEDIIIKMTTKYSRGGTVPLEVYNNIFDEWSKW